MTTVSPTVVETVASPQTSYATVQEVVEEVVKVPRKRHSRRCHVDVGHIVDMHVSYEREETVQVLQSVPTEKNVNMPVEVIVDVPVPCYCPGSDASGRVECFRLPEYSSG